MNEEKRTQDSARRHVSLRNLYLDPNNFRLIHEPEYVEVDDANAKDKVVMQRTLRLITGDRNQNIQDLLESFRSNGYLPVDQIQVRELQNGGYLVVEGNRRVAALKILQSGFEERGVDLGNLNPEVFSKVPVVSYDDADDLHHLTLMALKHISGNKKWGEWNQACLLQRMFEKYKLPEDNICDRIGITKYELRRSLRALSLVEQYKASDYGDQFESNKFPIFREVAKNQAIKDFLGWNEETWKCENKANTDFFFSLLSQEPTEETDGEDGGSTGNQIRPPALGKRDDVVLFGKVVNDAKALSQLKTSRDINAAYRSSDRIFVERQEEAIHAVANDIDTLSQMSVRSEHVPRIVNALGKLKSVLDRSEGSGLAGVEHKVVFHDRIEAHFTSLKIGNYKRLRDLEVTTLSRINLVCGLNNSGKTTLLEAIYLLARQNDFSGLLEAVRRRGKIAEDKVSPEWFIEQIPSSIILGGTFDHLQTSISIRHSTETGEGLDTAKYLETIEITSNFGQIKQESRTRIYVGKDRETHLSGNKILCPVVFSSPFYLNEPHRYASFYHKSVQSKSIPQILAFVRKIVPTIADIRLVDERQRFLVEDSTSQMAMDLTAYGEGLQRVFFNALLFAAAANGVILIDEFENAIHTELIPEFTAFLYQLSKTFNVQVFLTTHSKECIDAFVNNVPEIGDLTAHALVKKGEVIQVRQFSGSEFKRLLDAGDVDLRRAL